MSETRPILPEPAAAWTVLCTGCEVMSRDVAGVERIAREGSEGPTQVHYLYERAAVTEGGEPDRLETLRDWLWSEIDKLPEGAASIPAYDHVLNKIDALCDSPAPEQQTILGAGHG